MINAGTITPSHGKILLQADGLEKVYDYLREDIKQELEDYRTIPTVDELARTVQRGYHKNYREITDLYGFDQPQFDIETCKGCKTCRTFSHKHRPDQIYCLDETCFDKKQADAIEARISQEAKDQEKKAAVTLAAIDTGEESPAPEPEPMSDAAIAQKNGRMERTQQYLDEWLRLQLKEHLVDDEATKYAMLLWLAADVPGNYSYLSYASIDHYRKLF